MDLTQSVFEAVGGVCEGEANAPGLEIIASDFVGVGQIYTAHVEKGCPACVCMLVGYRHKQEASTGRLSRSHAECPE